MATYYVRADGTASAVNAVGPRTSASDCMSLATCNSTAYSPGDLIYICDDGGVYRGQLDLDYSGDSDDDLVFRGLGSPQIKASVVVTGWTASGTAGVYKATVTTKPQQIWIDGTYGDRRDVANEKGDGAETLDNEYDWYWDGTGAYYDEEANTLYLYAPSDPDSEYTEIEAGSELYAIDISDRSYIVIDNITASHGNERSIKGYNCNHFTIKNCTVEWAWWDGFETNSSTSWSGALVEDNLFRYNGVQGPSLNCGGTGGDTMSDIIVRRNVVIESGLHQQANGSWHYQQDYPGGIKFWCSTGGSYGENIEVYDNECYGGGPGAAGVWFDRVGNDGTNPNYVHHNYFHDNGGCGIFVEVSDYVISYSNVVYNSCNWRGTGGPWSTTFLTVHTRYQPPTNSLTSNGNKFYNNVCYADAGSAPRWGIVIMATDGTSGEGNGVELVDNIFMNNIVVGWTDRAIYADAGGDNDGSMGSGNTFWYNCFGPEDTDFIYWGGTSYSTYDTWEAAATVITDSGTTHSIEEDPGLEDPDNDQFWLGSESPCIGTGVDLGSPYNSGLMSTTTWPDGVVTGDRDDY